MRALRNLLLVALLPSAAMAQQAQAGPLIHSGGAVFDVPSPTFATPADMEFKAAFEVSTPASSPDQLNPTLNSVARYLNMHARAGVRVERIRAAVVVHGAAGWEVLDDAAYRERYGVDNPNAELVRELIAAGVPVVLCGQTAASRGIPRSGLIEGVDVALSAMTAFLVLQEQGYRVNPW